MPNGCLRKLQGALPSLIGRTITRITVRQHDWGRAGQQDGEHRGAAGRAPIL